MNVERVVPVGRPAGMLRCPSCGCQLGASDNPAIGYITHCSFCDVRLVVRVEGPAILLAVAAGQHDRSK